MGLFQPRASAWSFGRKPLKYPLMRALPNVTSPAALLFLTTVLSDLWEMAEHKKHIAFKGKILILGFGAVGQGTLPLLLRHIDMPKENVSIITAEDWGREIAEEYGVAFRVEPFTPENYLRILNQELKAGDFLFNASFDVSSLALIDYCSAHGIMYLDACIEP